MSELQQVIAEGEYYGRRTFHQCLLAHVRAGDVAAEEAMAYATTPHDFKLMLAGVNGAR